MGLDTVFFGGRGLFIYQFTDRVFFLMITPKAMAQHPVLRHDVFFSIIGWILAPHQTLNVVVGGCCMPFLFMWRSKWFLIGRLLDYYELKTDMIGHRN